MSVVWCCDPLGKSWWGSKGMLLQVIEPVAVRLSLVPGSRKRTQRLTSSGLPSDHWIGSLRAYATDYDFPLAWRHDSDGGYARGLHAAEDLAHALSLDGWKPNVTQSFIVDTWERGQPVGERKRFRLQLLFGRDIGHDTHVHAGLKRL